MNFLFHTIIIFISTGYLLFGNEVTSFAMGEKLLGPIEEAAPLVPVGPEFQVNTYTMDTQLNSDVAMDSEGNYVVTWQSGMGEQNGQDGDWSGIFAQRYDYTGTPLGVEFQVNTVINNAQDHPSVAMNDDGKFVIMWESPHGGTEFDVYGQRYDQLGNPIGPEFLVNTYADSRQSYPSVAMNNEEIFVAVWQSYGQDGSGLGIFAQRFDSTGTPVGAEFQVNSETSGNQSSPSVAMNNDGDIVILWSSDGQDGDESGVFGQRYNHTGAPEGSEFQVNTYTPDQQRFASVAMDSDGNFVAVWEDSGQPVYGAPGIYGQRYDFTGAPIRSEFQVNTSLISATRPTVAMDDNGNVWVAWRSDDQDRMGVFIQGYDSAGDLLGSESQVNTFTTNDQVHPDIVLNPSGQKAVISWASWGQDGTNYGIFAQRYRPNKSPTCAAATALPSNLFSNDHAFHVVDIANVWDPDGDSVLLTVDEIYQDETVNAAGSGFTSPDGQGIGSNAAEVRAEHVESGNGRTYRISFTAEDEWGESCWGAVYVRASPKSKVDGDWIIYDSTDTPDIIGELQNPNPNRPAAPIVNATQ